MHSAHHINLLLVVKIDVYTLKCNANVPQLKTGYIFRELGYYATVDIYW